MWLLQWLHQTSNGISNLPQQIWEKKKQSQFTPDDQNSLVDFLRTLSEGMHSMKFVEPTWNSSLIADIYMELNLCWDPILAESSNLHWSTLVPYLISFFIWFLSFSGLPWVSTNDVASDDDKTNFVESSDSASGESGEKANRNSRTNVVVSSEASLPIPRKARGADGRSVVHRGSSLSWNFTENWKLFAIYQAFDAAALLQSHLRMTRVRRWVVFMFRQACRLQACARRRLDNEIFIEVTKATIVLQSHFKRSFVITVAF